MPAYPSLAAGDLEGVWFDAGVVYLATTADGKVRAYDTATREIDVIYDKSRLADPPISGVDNLAVSSAGDLYIFEDDPDRRDGIDIALLTPERTVSWFLRLVGQLHIADGQTPSEATGPCARGCPRRRCAGWPAVAARSCSASRSR